MTIGGRTDVFGIDEDTGDIFTLVAISNTRTYKFNLSISASDGGDIQNEADLNITVSLIDTFVNVRVAFNKTNSKDKR